jgi:hypothetical protein
LEGQTNHGQNPSDDQEHGYSRAKLDRPKTRGRAIVARGHRRRDVGNNGQQGGFGKAGSR